MTEMCLTGGDFSSKNALLPYSIVGCKKIFLTFIKAESYFSWKEAGRLSSLSQLIERLEEASGPDRELDADIHLKLFTQAVRPETPAYTASIDATLTLLPEGFAVVNFMIWPGEGSSVKVLETRARRFGGNKRLSWVHRAGDRHWYGDAATPVTALLSAALKARQATEPTND